MKTAPARPVAARIKESEPSALTYQRRRRPTQPEAVLRPRRRSGSSERRRRPARSETASPTEVAVDATGAPAVGAPPAHSHQVRTAPRPSRPAIRRSPRRAGPERPPPRPSSARAAAIGRRRWQNQSAGNARRSSSRVPSNNMWPSPASRGRSPAAAERRGRRGCERRISAAASAPARRGGGGRAALRRRAAATATGTATAAWASGARGGGGGGRRSRLRPRQLASCRPSRRHGDAAARGPWGRTGDGAGADAGRHLLL